MQIRVLGHLEASVDDRPLALGGAKQRAVLAMLGLEANRTVSADRLIEGLWGEQAPASAPKMVQNYVWRLRGVLAADGGAQIVTHGRGYELRIDPELVDVRRFERLVAEAGRAAEAGEPATRRTRRWRCFAATRWPTWPTSRSRRRRSGGSRSCGVTAAELAIERGPRRRSPPGGHRRDRGAAGREPAARAAARAADAGAVPVRAPGRGAGGVPGRPAHARRGDRRRAGPGAAAPARGDPAPGPVAGRRARS